MGSRGKVRERELEAALDRAFQCVAVRLWVECLEVAFSGFDDLFDRSPSELWYLKSFGLFLYEN